MAGSNPDLVIRVAANIAALQTDMAAAVATLKTIEGAAKDTASGTSSLMSSFDGLGASWVARIAEGQLLRDAIREVLAAGQELIIGIPEEAKELRNLSLQTQISIGDLQLITAATREYGIEGDQLGRALFQLSQRIAGGDANVATAYHLMGISMDEVRGKGMLDLLLTTEHGLGTLSGAIQDVAAKDLYSGRLGPSMIAFSHDVDGAMDRAKALNTIASTESVEAAAKYADAIDRMTHSIHAWATEQVGAVAGFFNATNDALDKGASSWSVYTTAVIDYLSHAPRDRNVAEFTAALDKLNQTTDAGKDITLASAGAHDKATVALDAHAQAARFMATTELDSAKPLLDWQVEYLDHLKSINLLTAQNAAGIGVTVDQLKNYEAGLTAAKAASAALAKAEAEEDAIAMTAFAKHIKALQDLEKASQAAYSFDGQVANLMQLDRVEQALTADVVASLTSEKDRAKVVEEAALRHLDLLNQVGALERTHAAVVNAAVVAEFDAQVQLNAAQGLDASGAILVQKSAVEQLQIALDNLHLKKVDGISQVAQETVLNNAFTQTLNDEVDAINAAALARAKDTGTIQDNTAAKQAASDASTRAAELAMRGTMTSQFTLTGDASTWAAQVAKFGPTAQVAADSAGNPYVWIPGVNAGPPPPGSAHYADGVQNAPGGWSTVGERGPERMYVPPGADIYPTGSSSGGGDTYHIYVTNPLGTPAAIAKAVDDAVMARQRNSGQRMPA